MIARRDKHRDGAEPPDYPGSSEPGLSQLIRALTAKGHPHERTGRDTALAAFREASIQSRHRRGLFALARRPVSLAWAGRPPRLLRPVRFAAVAAAGVTALAGFTGAAYAQALPAPVQRIAYIMLAPLGVPNSKPDSAANNAPPGRSSGPAAAVTGSGAAPPASAGAACPCPGQSAQTAPALGADHYAITVTAASAQVPLDASDLFTGTVSLRGQPAAGIRIRLLEQVAGAAIWRLAASGRTGAYGVVVLRDPRVTASALFRLAGPAGARSAAITVTVAVTVRLRLASGPFTDRLIASAPGASPGETARLMELAGGSWEMVASKPIDPRLRAVFPLPAVSAAGHLYRVDLLDSATSTPTPSNLVSVPRPDSTGAKIITPTASQPPAGGPAPGVTPARRLAGGTR